MIEVRQLSKTYETPGENIRVLEGLDLSLAAGDTAAIIGPSGCGKSTLLNLLGALDRPTSGTIKIGDQDISTLSEEQAATFRNHSLGFIFQQQHLLPQLTVLENVLVPRLAGDWQEPAAETEQRARRQPASNSVGPVNVPTSHSRVPDANRVAVVTYSSGLTGAPFIQRGNTVNRKPKKIVGNTANSISQAWAQSGAGCSTSAKRGAPV